MSSSAELYIPGETTVPFQCTPGREEEIVATVLRKIFSAFSVFGSAYIIVTIYQKWKHNRRSIDPYCRILFGLSVYDIIWSFFPWFMGSWLMPTGTGHWGASGNTATCTLQGFFFWLGVPGAQYYQVLLSLHTLLLVTFRWTPLDFHQRIEKHAHAVIFVVSLTLATIPVFFEAYNPECSTCLPAPLPIWCGDWIFWGDGETECIRGSPTLSTAYYTTYLTNLSFMGVFCTGSMITVYLSVRRQEDRNLRYSSYLQSESHRQKSQRIRRTMILYTFGFYLCWVIPSFIIHFAEQGTPYMIMSYILLPFQGFFNMLIFLSPRCSKYMKDHQGTWLVMAYIHVIFDGPVGHMKRICGSIVGMRPFAGITERSSHFMTNPFRGSINNTTNVIATADGIEDDDDLGFNGYNEDLQTQENRQSQSPPPQHHVDTPQEKLDEREKEVSHTEETRTDRQDAVDVPEQYPQNNSNSANRGRDIPSSSYCDATGTVVERKDS